MRLQAAIAFLALLLHEGDARLSAPVGVNVTADKANAVVNSSQVVNVLQPGQAAVVKVEVVNVTWTSSQAQTNHSKAVKSPAGSLAQKRKAKVNKKLEIVLAALKDVENEIVEKKKELVVQTMLVHEKDNATDVVRRQVKELKQTAETLRKEADVAVQIGQEKTRDAKKAEKEQKIVDSKVKELEGLRVETKKFFNQTQSEEHVLEMKEAALQKEKQTIQEQDKETEKRETNGPPAAPAAAVALAAARQKVVKAHQGNSTTTSNSSGVSAAKVTVAETVTGDAKSLKEAMKKLLAENQQLKREKEEISHELAMNRASQEKALLKRKLKNRLVQKDRVGLKAQAKQVKTPLKAR